MLTTSFLVLVLVASAGSTLIKDVSDFSNVFTILKDTCSSASCVRTKDTILVGADPTRLRSPLHQNSGVSVSYSMPLVSIVGTLSGGDRYLPFHALAASPRLSITWADFNQACACAGAPTAVSGTITNVSLSTQNLTLDAEVFAQIAAASNNLYQWSSSIWKTYRDVHAAGQQSRSIVIPARNDSVKSVFITQREAANANLRTANSVHDRIRNLLVSYRARVGSQWVNNSAVSTTGNALEAYCEMTRVFSNPASESSAGLFALTDWIKDTSTAPTTTSVEGSFLIGQEMESFSNSKLISGQSTAANSLVIELTYTGSPLAVNIDTVVEVDAKFQIDGATGQMSVAY
jgi:hypothetical protein